MDFKIIDWIDRNKNKFIEISNLIWEYAELGLFEEKSATLHQQNLKEAGFEVTRGIAGLPTALIASYGDEKPIIGILGEYDALPGLSQTIEPIKNPLEEGAPGHGCGHNLFGSACLAASIAIKESIERGDLLGTIQYYGCPAEENADGKGWMVKAGVFNGVDITLTWHPDTINSVVSYNYQAMYHVIFRYQGKAAHAAADPFNGRSALDAVELLNVGCNYLREHIIPEARIHYIITKGGAAPNIVPAEAEAYYYVRAPRLDQVKEIYSRVVNVAKGAALMTETKLEIVLLGGVANLLPNTILENLLYEKLEHIGISKFDLHERKFAQEIRKTLPERFFDNFLTIYPPDGQNYLEKYRNSEFCDTILPIFGRGTTIGGSTDVGDVSWVTPLAQFTTVCGTLGTPFHSWQFVAQSGMSIGHKGMLQAAKILGLTVSELMLNPELVVKAQQEFQNRVQKTPYESPIPEGTEPAIEYYRKLYK